MKLTEIAKAVFGEKKLMTLALMLVCGAVLVILSYRMAEQPERMADDITYTKGSLEQRLSYVLSMIEGAGDAEVMVTQNENEVIGVLIIADGAQDLTVRTELMCAAMTALDVTADQVDVFVRKKEGT